MKTKKSKQLQLPIPKGMQAYGGDLRRKKKNRGARTLVIRNGSMLFTLRSTKARGIHSFLHANNKKRIESFLKSFSVKNGVEILRFANVGNHLHLHVKIHSQRLYKAWIRGLSSGIAMICMGLEGFQRIGRGKFWDQRPFSRVIQSFRHFLNTKSYVEINQLEGLGMPRAQAELLIKGSRQLFKSTA